MSAQTVTLVVTAFAVGVVTHYAYHRFYKPCDCG
jgi:hypothetical protein